MHILFVASEVHPLTKTGGLGDVAGSLPAALGALGLHVRVLMPAYRDALMRCREPRVLAQFSLRRVEGALRLLEARVPPHDVTVWLLDYPPAYDRPGNPYLMPDGTPWPDNAERFALLAHTVQRLCQDTSLTHWPIDLVHANDWQTGLVPVLLRDIHPRPACLFTIHNLSYQGLFPYGVFQNLGLPASLWHPDGVEFYGQVSFMKAGLMFADRINTVSPTYAREIQTERFGDGLDGVLRARQSVLSGILNGIDLQEWDPRHDNTLVAHYDRDSLAGKQANKAALQSQFQLDTNPDIMLVGSVGRMVEQKGVDLIIEVLPTLMPLPIQWIILGSGEARFENALRALARAYPDKIGLHVGYDEQLAHRIEAGSDAFLMPSRFEPCGLNQLYSLRYGSVPIVHRVGGLADTVVDASPAHLAQGTATGIVFDTSEPQALCDAVTRAVGLFRDAVTWRRIIRTGMAQDFGWGESARQYQALYEQTRAIAVR